ncbi:glycosyltransferase family 4 protein [Methanococcoides burtonii]|uniref:Glycosyl transferase, group I n=1 Tax=Methanococcoides burtonii (strain DSM 6242 / NBRC 107633 / OCM 468 / ACE-M) TaxID=259564 RepID=Q12XY7_METBU|nr:glycosyltransferase family 4 protein [Methanococcoides burtonii]ABE51689.1 Glycosyl transferase, group I [Methanococcoides burtonii DSM 6242]
MKLVYYYPMSKGAPSNVARNVFEALIAKKDKLPFDEIILYTNNKNKVILGKKYSDIKIFTGKDILKIKNSIVHIPTTPLVFPNSKFLLHVFAKIKKNKLILNYHGDICKELVLRYKYDHKLELSKIPTCILLPILLFSSNKNIVNSYSLANIFKHRYGLGNIEVVPNAIDNCWFLKRHEFIKKSDNSIKIFYHGRLSPEKGVDLLIKGLKLFLSTKSGSTKIYLYIAGDGPQMQYLKALSIQLDIVDNVIFLGNLNQKMIIKYLQKVDAAIYPSILDTFALAILEAFACAECPVYFSKKAGIYDFIIDDGYVLGAFEPNVENISNIVSSIFEKSNKNDNIIEHQKKFAEKYNWTSVIDYYISIYREMYHAN